MAIPQETPLEWWLNQCRLNIIKAVAFSVYETLDKYRFNEDSQWVSIESALTVFKELVSKLEIGQEVGLCSHVSYFGPNYSEFDKLVDVMFADCDVVDINEVKYDLPGFRIVQTDKGFHAYSFKLFDDFEELQDILNSIKCVDKSWVKCGRRREFNVLRLTNNTKQVLPHFVY